MVRKSASGKSHGKVTAPARRRRGVGDATYRSEEQVAADIERCKENAEDRMRKARKDASDAKRARLEKERLRVKRYRERT